MRVINDPQAIISFEKMYSILDTLMSIRPGRSALSPADFSHGYQQIFNQECCTFLNSAAGRAAITPWQVKYQFAWSELQQTQIAIRLAEHKAETTTSWARSLFCSETTHWTTWSQGAANPAEIVCHMNTLHLVSTVAMEVIYRARLAELEKHAGVPIEM